jgi:hypothetical protein
MAAKYPLKSSGVTTMNSIVKVVQPSGILDSVSINQLRREISDIVETEPILS